MSWSLSLSTEEVKFYNHDDKYDDDDDVDDDGVCGSDDDHDYDEY